MVKQQQEFFEMTRIMENNKHLNLDLIWDLAKLNKDWQWETNQTFNGVDVYVCATGADAYSLSQGLDTDKNNSILYIPSENIVAVANTWPIAVTKNSGEFHIPKDWENADRYDFKNAVEFAVEYEGRENVVTEAINAIA